jgi:hypothetical protein
VLLNQFSQAEFELCVPEIKVAGERVDRRSWKGHLAHAFDPGPNGHKAGQLGKRRVGVRGLDGP